jgi:hypothetical protein
MDARNKALASFSEKRRESIEWGTKRAEQGIELFGADPSPIDSKKTGS